MALDCTWLRRSRLGSGKPVQAWGRNRLLFHRSMCLTLLHMGRLTRLHHLAWWHLAWRWHRLCGRCLHARQGLHTRLLVRLLLLLLLLLLGTVTRREKLELAGRIAKDRSYG